MGRKGDVGRDFCVSGIMGGAGPTPPPPSSGGDEYVWISIIPGSLSHEG